MRAVDSHVHLFDVVSSGGRGGGLLPRLLMAAFSATGYRHLLRAPGLPLRALESAVRERIAGAMRESSPDDLRRAMGRAGVGIALVAPVHPHVSTARVIEACDFTSLFPLSSPPVERADAVETCARDLDGGCVGVKIHPLVQGVGWRSPVCRELLELCGRRGLPLLTHAGGSARMFRRGAAGRPLPASDLRLLARSVPGAPLVVAHCGLWQNREFLDAVRDLDHVFLETSFQGASFLRELVNAVGAGRILFGSDFPIGDPAAFRREIERAGLPPSDRERILRGNALALFPIGRAYRARGRGGSANGPVR